MCAPTTVSSAWGRRSREESGRAARDVAAAQLTQRGHTGLARLTFSFAAGQVLPPLALLTLTPHIACLAALSFAIEVWGMSMGTMMIVHVLVL